MGITPRLINSGSNGENPFVFLFAGNRYSWNLNINIPDWLIPLNGQSIEDFQNRYPDLWEVKESCPFIVPIRGEGFSVKNYNRDGQFARAGTIPGIEQSSLVDVNSVRLRYAIKDKTGTKDVSKEESGFLHASDIDRQEYGVIRETGFYLRGGGNETRPINISEIWCLITKNLKINLLSSPISNSVRSSNSD